MKRIFSRLFWQREDGATAVEYAVVLALILMVVFGAVVLVGQKTNQSWTNTDTQLSNVNFGS